MTHQDNKIQVLQNILTFLQAYQDPPQAVVATLGGEGLESSLWLTRNITLENTWIVERNRVRSRKLLQQHTGHHLHGALTDFPIILEATCGPKAALDLFHWDLCGTVEPCIDEMIGVLPSILRSQGRCLAVTVADSRRNLSLEAMPVVTRIGRKVFGDQWKPLWEKLLIDEMRNKTGREREGAKPEAVAVREVGFYLYMLFSFASIDRHPEKDFVLRAEPFPLTQFMRFDAQRDLSKAINALIKHGTLHCVPDHLERIVYFSGTNCFRMRNYVFHLRVAPEALTMHQAAQQLAALILKDERKRIPLLLELNQQETTHMTTTPQTDGATAEQSNASTEPPPAMRPLDLLIHRVKTMTSFLNEKSKEDIETMIDLARTGEQASSTSLEALRAVRDIVSKVLKSEVELIEVQTVTSSSNGDETPAPRARRASREPKELSEEQKDSADIFGEARQQCFVAVRV